MCNIQSQPFFKPFQRVVPLIGGVDLSPIALLVVNGLIGVQSLKSVHNGLTTVYNDRVVPLRDLKLISDLYAVNIVDADAAAAEDEAAEDAATAAAAAAAAGGAGAGSAGLLAPDVAALLPGGGSAAATSASALPSVAAAELGRRLREAEARARELEAELEGAQEALADIRSRRGADRSAKAKATSSATARSKTCGHKVRREAKAWVIALF